MENKLILYMHAGSGNHGCEAIVNSLCHMVKGPISLVSYRAKEDEKYSLGELCQVMQERSFEGHKCAHVLYYIYRKLTGDKESFIRYRYRQAFECGKIPLAISIGGDNYCYDSMLNDLRLANSAFHKAGVQTMLLGCSIEPELLGRQEIMKDLSAYHTIIARESITYNALKQAFYGTGEEDAQKAQVSSGIPYILCYPDPAFTLKAKELPLPEGFVEGNTVGINISPMVQDNEEKGGITIECYRELIRYIIEKTDMQIALIPHVIWMNNDDRKPIRQLYDDFKASGRVVEIGDGSCEELKGYIGRCSLFVGARTHATIAAYSSCVPTLVVGYSVKARGIAKDLFGTEKHYVLPVQELEKEGELIGAYDWMMGRETEIREMLERIMPGYCARAGEAGEEIRKLWRKETERR